MDVVGILLGLAAKYGAKALVRALDGNEESQGAAGELAAALVAGQLATNARLQSLDRSMAELLDQRFQSSLNSANRYVGDYLTSPSANSGNDLARAREALVESVGAARNPLQVAQAERLMTMVHIAMNQFDLAARSLFNLELNATRAIFTLSGPAWSHKATEKVLRSEGVALLPLLRDGKIHRRLQPLRDSSSELGELAAQVLSDASVLAEGLGLPPRSPIESVHLASPTLGRAADGTFRFGAVTATSRTLLTPGSERAPKAWFSYQPYAGPDEIEYRFSFDPPFAKQMLLQEKNILPVREVHVVPAGTREITVTAVRSVTLGEELTDFLEQPDVKGVVFG